MRPPWLPGLGPSWHSPAHRASRAERYPRSSDPRSVHSVHPPGRGAPWPVWRHRFRR